MGQLQLAEVDRNPRDRTRYGNSDVPAVLPEACTRAIIEESAAGKISGPKRSRSASPARSTGSRPGSNPLGARTTLKHPFDFGRIDVHPARDDHVPLAIVEKQIAVGIEVSDVTARDQLVDFDGAITAHVIVEIR